MNNQSENLNELATALAKCQGELSPAIKDSSNPFFKSRYADLNAVWQSCRPALSKYGLAVIQTIQKDEGSIVLVTTLVHSSGQWIRSISPVPLLKSDPQALGSALTYMRRYSLSAIVGISTDDDDDGERAMNRNGKPEEKKKELISQSQAAELLYLFDKCDADYCEKLNKYLSSEKIINLEKLPLDMFEKVKAGILKNVEVNKGKQENV